MKITLEISAERIANMMVSAIESGDPVTTARKGGWCMGIFWKTMDADPNDYEFADPKDAGGAWYGDEAFWASDFQIQILEVANEDIYQRRLDIKGNIKSGALALHTVKPEHFIKGLTIMAQKFPHLFGEILNDNSDAPCADIFLQCVLFGEEKFA